MFSTIICPEQEQEEEEEEEEEEEDCVLLNCDQQQEPKQTKNIKTNQYENSSFI